MKKEITKGKIIIGFILILVIIIANVMLWLSYDDLMSNKVMITYPDGCIEWHINGDLNGTPCLVGRLMHNDSIERQRNSRGNSPLWNRTLNLTEII